MWRLGLGRMGLVSERLFAFVLVWGVFFVLFLSFFVCIELSQYFIWEIGAVCITLWFLPSRNLLRSADSMIFFSRSPS